MKRNSAFTLIELSIVLVIIGLIVGGVLVGQDLIAASKMRKQMSTLEQLDVAVNTFRLKYNALAGDMTLADAATFGLPYVSNAQSTYNFHDGGKKITHYGTTTCNAQVINNVGPDLSCSNAYFGEPHYFFVQLYAANLSSFDVGLTANVSNLTISGVKMDIGTGYIYPTSTPYGKNGYFLGMGTSSTTNHFLTVNATAGSITPMQAFQMDNKFDDGSPDKGKILAANPIGSSGPFTDWGPIGAYNRNCVTGPNNDLSYDLTTSPDTNECQLWVKASW